jgi:hypothetical protein
VTACPEPPILYDYSVTPTGLRVNQLYYTIYCIWLNLVSIKNISWRGDFLHF